MLQTWHTPSDQALRNVHAAKRAVVHIWEETGLILRTDDGIARGKADVVRSCVVTIVGFVLLDGSLCVGMLHRDTAALCYIAVAAAAVHSQSAPLYHTTISKRSNTPHCYFR